MPEILFVATPDWYVTSHRLELADHLLSRGWRVSIAAPCSGKPRSDRLGAFPLHDIQLDRQFISFSREVRSLLDLRLILARIRPDVVHLFSPKAVVFGGAIARLTGTPAVLSPGGLGTAFLGRGLRAMLERMVIRCGIGFALGSRNARIILQNADEVALLTGGRLAYKVRLISGCGIDTASFAMPPADTSHPPTILMAGRLLRSKGIVEFAQAAAIVRQHCPDALFRIVGALDDGNKNGLSNSDMADLKVEYGIEWDGPVPDIRPSLRDATIAVLPSHSEGLSRFLIEAAAAGRPIVATDIAGNRPIVHDGVNGLLVPVGNAAALAKALGKLLQDAPLRKTMGLAGVQMAGDFDIRAIGARTEAIYQEIYRGR